MRPVKFPFLLLTFLLVLSLIPAPVVAQSEQKRGRVFGTVSDTSAAVIPGVKVTFVSDESKHELTTDEEGNYDINLPPGTYQVLTEATGFCPTERAAFEVLPSSTLIINLTLVVCAIAHGMKVDAHGKYAGEVAWLENPYKSESFPLESSAKSAKRLLIKYGKRQERDGIIEYTGAEGQGRLAVIVSYDVWTIYAERVRFDKRSLQLEAGGRVIIEDGQKHTRLNTATLDFSSGKPLIKTGKEP